VIVIASGVAILALGAGAVFFSRSLQPRQRAVFWIVVALAAVYFVPLLFRGALAGYRTGAEIRHQQSR